jgi:hypothetical protein
MGGKSVRKKYDDKQKRGMGEKRRHTSMHITVELEERGGG